MLLAVQSWLKASQPQDALANVCTFKETESSLRLAKRPVEAFEHTDSSRLCIFALNVSLKEAGVDQCKLSIGVLKCLIST